MAGSRCCDLVPVPQSAEQSEVSNQSLNWQAPGEGEFDGDNETLGEGDGVAWGVWDADGVLLRDADGLQLEVDDAEDETLGEVE